jgi:hypothetical protein
MNKKILTVIVSLFISFGLSLSVCFLFQPQETQAQAGPWLSGYNYRREITIDGTAAGAQANYQMKLTVDVISLNNHTQNDFDDIRFTKSDGITLLDYWLETSDANTATIWVEFDSIPASPDSASFYMYYGNPLANSDSNGDDTFVFFDDFTGTTIDTAKWTEVDGSNYITQNDTLIVSNGTTAWGATGMYTKSNFNRADNLLVQGKYKSTWARNATDYFDTTMFWIKDTTASIDYPTFIYAYYPHYFYDQAAKLLLYEDGSGRGGELTPNLAQNTQYWFRQIIKSGGGALYQMSTDRDNWTTHYDSTYSTETPFKVGFTHYRGGDILIDDIIVRKYVTPEPTLGVLGEEEEYEELIISSPCQTHNVSGYAWSENIGWISFSCENESEIGQGVDYGVDIDREGDFSGYAWSENIGWVSFNQDDLIDCPDSPCQAVVDLESGDVSGWARALSHGDGWDGWIELRGTGSETILNDDPTSDMLSQSGLISFSATGTVDNNPTGTYAWHTDSSSAGAWMKIDLGSDNEKNYLKARIYAVSPGYKGNYTIQYSDDGSSWLTAVTGFIPSSTGWNEKTWTSVGSHRYWRFYLANTPGPGSWLSEIEMYNSVAPSYEVLIDEGNFSGWAWGEEIVGWVSFNCSNRDICYSSTEEGGPSDYKVVADLSFNSPPSATNNEVSFLDECTYNMATPSFSWTYSDPEDDPPGTDPQTQYQIRIRGSSTFPVDEEGEAILQDDEFKCSGQICSASSELNYFSPISGSWIDWANYGEPYYWTVRVKDSQDKWSDWSDLTSFVTQDHKYPQVDFLCNGGDCESAPIDEDVVISLTNNSTVEYEPYSCFWELPTGGYELVEGYSLTDCDLEAIFYPPAPGERTQTIELTITEDEPYSYSCSESKDIEIKVPLPEYREISPLGWFKDFLDESLANIGKAFLGF